MTSWHKRQTCHFFITEVCHASSCHKHSILIFNSWYPRYWILGHTFFKQLSFLHCCLMALKFQTVIKNMFIDFFVKFCGILMSSFETMLIENFSIFRPYNIYIYMFIYQACSIMIPELANAL